MGLKSNIWTGQQVGDYRVRPFITRKVGKKNVRLITPFLLFFPSKQNQETHMEAIRKRKKEWGPSQKFNLAEAEET